MVRRQAGIILIACSVLVVGWAGSALASGGRARASTARCTPHVTGLSHALRPSATQDVVIRGRCLGTLRPFARSSTAVLRLDDLSNIENNYCGDGEVVVCRVTRWRDDGITLAGFGHNYSGFMLDLGDRVAIHVRNPETGVAARVCTVRVGVSGRCSR